MCGIFGYIGKRRAAPIVVEGLQVLEYRGYDSFGVATCGSSVEVVKAQGRISDLGSIAMDLPGSIGIGHTRWATHGVPSDCNAHPHTDCSGAIAIVHNGIIENYVTLRRELLEAGHVFTSDTDSEVIAHLLESYYEGDLLEAMRQTTERLEGAYAILAVEQENDAIVAARLKSPLILGYGDGEFLAASDMTPLLGYTQSVLPLEDGDIAVLTHDEITLYAGEEEILREWQTIDWDAESARKGGYDHYMQKEIFEQPEVFFRTFTAIDETDLGALSEAKSIRVVACGTSYHAGLIFRYLMAEYSDIPVTVEIGSECRLIRPLNHELVIGITQSGETADTIAALQSAIAHNCPTLAITNVLGSSVTRVADNTIFTHAGPEISVAATKSFIAQVAVFLKMTSWLCNGAFPINPVECKQAIDKILLWELDEAVTLCSQVSSMFFIGRGIFYPVALEGALKMKEITYIHAEGYAAGELKHGPFALLSEETPVVALCLPGDDYDQMFANIKEIKARSAPVIAIGVEQDHDLEDLVDIMIPIPPGETAEHLLSSLVLLQMLSYETAKRLGRDVDKPRNLAKSVTVI